MKIVKLIIFFFLILNTVSVLSQEREEFYVYVLKNRYNDEGIKFIESNNIFKEIKALTGYMIDPKKANVIDLNTVEKYLIKLYPEANDSGMLYINLENVLYKDLNDFYPPYERFETASIEFRNLLLFIKNLRPNLKLGIYGLPFRVYYPSELRKKRSSKLDEILSLTDFLCPSLYILKPDKELGESANNTYFKNNLDIAFEYGERLNKPVIPFVFYMVHPGNKRYGGELLGKDEMKRYMSYIKNYRSTKNSSVKGVIYWDIGKEGFDNWLKPSSQLKGENFPLNNNGVLEEYIKYFQK